MWKQTFLEKLRVPCFLNCMCCHDWDGAGFSIKGKSMKQWRESYEQVLGPWRRVWSLAPLSLDVLMLMMLFTKHPCSFNFWADGRVELLAPLWSEVACGCSGQWGCSGNNGHHFQARAFLGLCGELPGHLLPLGQTKCLQMCTVNTIVLDALIISVRFIKKLIITLLTWRGGCKGARVQEREANFSLCNFWTSHHVRICYLFETSLNETNQNANPQDPGSDKSHNIHLGDNEENHWSHTYPLWILWGSVTFFHKPISMGFIFYVRRLKRSICLQRKFKLLCTIRAFILDINVENGEKNSSYRLHLENQREMLSVPAFPRRGWGYHQRQRETEKTV